MVRVQALGVQRGGRWVFSGLSAPFGPGLHWVLGDEGRGKSTLLAVLAGRLSPTLGRVQGPEGGSVFLEDLTDPALDHQTGLQWLAVQQERHPAWNPDEAQALARAYALEPHLPKPLEQLSAGSRRKVGLLAAQASGARLTLLDQPFAALDLPSRRVLLGHLQQAAASPDRVWVVADYGRPDDGPAGAVIDLDRLSQAEGDAGVGSP